MDADLRRDGLLARFPPETETEYRRWLVVEVRPNATLVGFLSIGIWLVSPLIFLAQPGKVAHTGLLFAGAWGFNIPLLAVTTWYAWRPTSRNQILAVTVAVIAIGLSSLALLPEVLPRADIGSYAFLITFFTMLAPLLQLPFRSALVTSLLLTVAGTAAVQLGTDSSWDELFLGPNTTLPLIALVIIPWMAFAGERNLRARFVDERVIERQRALIRRYAPSSVVSRIEQDDHTVDHPQRRKVTVFFSDVVGFTALADRVDPEALAVIVNDYLGALSEVVERHGGTLNEFAGDGVMAIFGAPDELDPQDQVMAAIAAAQELQRSLPEWSRHWYQHGIIEDAQARVGINTGTVSVGTFGSAVRATYTGIGLQTNIAARVQAEAEPGRILLSNTSWHLVKDRVVCEERGEVMVKGVHFPIRLYEPLTADPS